MADTTPRKAPCPGCQNDWAYVIRRVEMMAEDTDKPKVPQPPGAGITHPAFDLAQMTADLYICRSCGMQYYDKDMFIARS